MKRLETFLTSPGQADPARQPLGRTVCWLENPRPAPFPLQQSSTRPGHLKSPCQPEQSLSRNGLHGRISAQKPALNKRQLKNCVAFAKAHSLPKGWTLEKWQKVDFSDESSVELHHSHRKYCRRPTGARMDPRFTQKTVKFGGGKIMVWGYIQYGGVRGKQQGLKIHRQRKKNQPKINQNQKKEKS